MMCPIQFCSCGSRLSWFPALATERSRKDGARDACGGLTKLKRSWRAYEPL